MRIGFSISPQRYLNRTAGALQTSLERLSSGKRINSAKDDAAGLSMSVGLDAQVRGSGVAIRNANDGMSMLSVAEGSLNEMTNLLQSMRELAVQAANGTLSAGERSAINDQVSGLIEEYDRIAGSADFNGIKLLDGTFGTRALQVGNTKSSQINISTADLRKEAAFQKTVGTGAFGSAANFTGGGSVGSLASVDLNSDGNLDVVSASNATSAVDVFLGNGDGTFKPRTSLSASLGIAAVQTADVNGDGIQDVLAAGGKVDVWLGNGDGTFKPRSSFTGGNLGYSSFTIGDLNGDGAVDVVVPDYGSGEIDILLGNGDGSLKSGSPVSTSGFSVATTVVDLNGDEKLDIVEVVEEIALRVYLGNGDGTFKTAIEYCLLGDMGASVAAGDFNHDGKVDLIAGDQIGNGLIFLGNGDGTLKDAITCTFFNAPFQLTVGDLNGDDIDDVIGTANSDRFEVLIGNGDGSFNEGVSYLQDTNFGLAVGDYDNNGVLDVVTGGTGITLRRGNSHDVTAVVDMNLTTQERAQSAISIIDDSLDFFASKRATVGSLQSRLEASIAGLYTSRENLSRAYSEIVDADIASETAELVRQQITQQAGIAMLAQGNVMQANVLALLQA